MSAKILIMGLPGAGKTTLALRLAPLLKAVHFDADVVRPRLWPELGFDLEDRIENSRRIGSLCDIVNAAGHRAIASFVCPTPETRIAFVPDYIIWIDRIKAGRFADTNRMFIPPEQPDIRLTVGSPQEWVDRVMNECCV